MEHNTTPILPLYQNLQYFVNSGQLFPLGADLLFLNSYQKTCMVIRDTIKLRIIISERGYSYFGLT